MPTLWSGQEHDLLEPMVKGIRENFRFIGKEEDVFKKARLSAGSGFHTEKNMKMLFSEGIDAYVADTMFRKRDPRFSEYDRYKERTRRNLFQSRILPFLKILVTASVQLASACIDVAVMP